MSINEEYIVNRYEDNHSTYSIAKELGTYPKKIERILKKHGVQIRSRSDAQKLAMESGRNKHPTKGRRRTKEEKVKISEGVHQNWKNMTDEQRDQPRHRLPGRGALLPSRCAGNPPSPMP